MALQNQIPFPDETSLHAASAYLPSSIPGSEDYWCTEGSYDTDTHHVLEAGPGELAWAMYRLPTYGYPALSLVVNLTLGGGQVFCGIANYDKRSWDFSPKQTSPEYSRTIAASSISPQDRIYVVVAAYDAAAVTVIDCTILLDQPTWHSCTVAAGVTNLEGLQLYKAGSGGKPRLAALDPQYLKFYSSSEVDPQNSADWTSVAAADAGELDDFEGPLRAEWVSGRPAMAYIRHGAEHQLCYTYGTIPEPGASDWVTANVDGTAYFPTHDLGLCAVAGNPRLIYEQFDTDAVWLASSPTSTPDSGDWTITKVKDGAMRPSLAVVNDRLACTYYIDVEPDAKRFCYSRAIMDDPVGPLSWEETGLYSPIWTNFHSMTEIIATPLDSMQAPVVAYIANSWSRPQVVSASVAEPTTVAQWDFSPVDLDVEIDYFEMELKLVGDRPAMVYFADNLRRLQFAHALTANPVTQDDWQITTLVSAAEIVRVALAEVDGRPAVAYYDLDGYEIRYAHYVGE